jgi:hypothetical protein
VIHSRVVAHSHGEPLVCALHACGVAPVLGELHGREVHLMHIAGEDRKAATTRPCILGT